MKFIVVGILNTIVGFSVFYLSLEVFHFNYLVSLVISHIIGVTNSYLWNKSWTFNIRYHSFSMVLKFGLTYLLTFIINSALLVLLVEIFKQNPVISQLFSMVITTAISFVGQKYWSFKVKIMESE
ncbi:GtrA family protein [Paenibacillus sp. MCAF9]